MRLIGQLIPPEVVIEEIRNWSFRQEVLITDNRLAVVKHKVSIVTDDETDDREDKDDDTGDSRREGGQRQAVIPCPDSVASVGVCVVPVSAVSPVRRGSCHGWASLCAVLSAAAV